MRVFRLDPVSVFWAGRPCLWAKEGGASLHVLFPLPKLLECTSRVLNFVCLGPQQLALNSVLDLEVDTSGTQGLISLLTEKIMTASSGVGGHHGISVALVQLHVLA